MKLITILLATAGLLTSTAQAGKARTPPPPPVPTLQISLEDSGNVLTISTRSLLLSNIQAAFSLWAANINSSAAVTATVRIVSNTQTGRIDCASTSNKFLKTVGGVSIWEESAAYKLRTGLSVNVGQPDLVIQIDPVYLTQELWLDSRPKLRIDPVPSNKIDAVSIFTHELAHAFGFQTFRNLQTGDPLQGYMTVYDQFVVVNGSLFTFSGVNANKEFGFVELTSTNTTQNIRHLADSLSDPLANDLMNGIEYNHGTRYYISNTDLGILKDLGLPIL
jgi:hypothetical protein